MDPVRAQALEMMVARAGSTDPVDTAGVIAARLAIVTAQRKQLEEEEKFLRHRLVSLLPIGSTPVTAGRTVSIRHNRRFDSGTALEVLTPVELELVTTSVVSRALAQEKLPPERYELCQVIVGEPVVTLK